MLITNGLFIQINSTAFCNKYLYTSYHDEPIVSTKQFLHIMGGIIIVVTFIVHFFIQEREKVKNSPPNSDDTFSTNGEDRSVLDVLRRLKGFITNKNLLLFLFFLLTYNIGLSPVRSSLGVLLINQGLQKEVLSSISSIVIPFNFIAAVMASKFIRPNQEMNVWRVTFILMMIDSLIGYSIVKLHPVIDSSNQQNLFFAILGYYILSTFIGTFRFIALGGFYNRISDEDVGGSSLTALNSLSNLGGQLSE